MGAAARQKQVDAAIPNRILQEKVANRLRQFERLVSGHEMSGTGDHGDGCVGHKLQQPIRIFVRQGAAQSGTDQQHRQCQRRSRRPQ